MDHPFLAAHDAALAAFYSISALRGISGQIARARSASAPRIEIIRPAGAPANTAPLLVLPGSYNPPTNAHLALGQASLQTVPDAQLYLSLGTTIINKERTERATLLDRLLLLNHIARRYGTFGVLLTNRGLYVEQAEALRSAFPQASALYFVLGFDKIEQIFDARYYQDRDAALTRLFALASFLVAPRDSHEAPDLTILLNQPENQPFQACVRTLPLPVEYRGIASSQIRAAFAAIPNNQTASPLADSLPAEVLAFCIETGCYLPAQRIASGERIDRYGLRIALIDRALALPEAEQAALDLRRLFHLAISDSDAGQRLRRWLRQPEETISPRDLLSFQQHARPISLQ
jgi:nicotinamide-nucleotide adenylyltransferase